MATTRADVKITGRSLGGAFAEETRDFALLLGLAGWVRKENEGQFEASFEGDEEAVSEMIRFCKSGSRQLEVRELDITFLEEAGREGFELQGP